MFATHDPVFLILGMPGGSEIIIILLLAVLFFGAKKIPEVMRGMGQGVKEFKRGLKEGEMEDNDQDPPAQLQEKAGQTQP